MFVLSFLLNLARQRPLLSRGTRSYPRSNRHSSSPLSLQSLNARLALFLKALPFVPLRLRALRPAHPRPLLHGQRHPSTTRRCPALSRLVLQSHPASPEFAQSHLLLPHCPSRPKNLDRGHHLEENHVQMDQNSDPDLGPTQHQPMDPDGARSSRRDAV